MNFQNWLKGLGVAVGGALLTAGVQVASNRLQNGKNAPPITGGNLAVSAGTAGIMAAIAYMAQSPIPPIEVAPVVLSPSPSNVAISEIVNGKRVPANQL